MNEDDDDKIVYDDEVDDVNGDADCDQWLRELESVWWSFDESRSPYVEKEVRLFDDDEYVDGYVICYIPKDGDDVALWKVVRADEQRHDLKLDMVEKAEKAKREKRKRKYYHDSAHSISRKSSPSSSSSSSSRSSGVSEELSINQEDELIRRIDALKKNKEYESIIDIIEANTSNSRIVGYGVTAVANVDYSRRNS